jgi:hypothetical protein
MGFSRRRRGNDGRPRYTAYYRDLRGREVSAGTFARKADADAAWQAAEAGARAGLRHDPGRGRQRFQHYAEAAWLPNHRMELSTRADYTPAIYRHIVPRAHAREKAARDWPVSSPPVQRTEGRAAQRLPWPRPIPAGTPAIGGRGVTIDALPSGHPYREGRGGRPPVTHIAIWRSCGSAPGAWIGNAR